MSEEEWRTTTYSADYEVSNLGRVRSLLGSEPRLLKPSITSHGFYPVVSLHGKWSTIHRLVALAFLEKTGPVVRHLDGDPSNNRVENLAWGTYQENNLDTVRHGHHAGPERTHCPKGHEYTPENTKVQTRPDGRKSRACRTCSRAAYSAWVVRMKAEAVA